MNKNPKAATGEGDAPRVNEYRGVKAVWWLQRELKRLIETRPVSFGTARIALELKISDASERLTQIS